jgi:copper(I)-binding protein
MGGRGPGPAPGTAPAAALATLLAGLAACEVEVPYQSDAGEAVEEVAGIAAVGPWVRAAMGPAAGADSPAAGPVAPAISAAYLVIRNVGPRPDALVAVESEVADTAELHDVSMADGVMRMRAVNSVAVPAGGGVALEPGGLHVMLVGLRRALAEGDSVPLTLRFRSGRILRLTAPVHRAPHRP